MEEELKVPEFSEEEEKFINQSVEIIYAYLLLGMYYRADYLVQKQWSEMRDYAEKLNFNVNAVGEEIRNRLVQKLEDFQQENIKNPRSHERHQHYEVMKAAGIDVITEQFGLNQNNEPKEQ